MANRMAPSHNFLLKSCWRPQLELNGKYVLIFIVGVGWGWIKEGAQASPLTQNPAWLRSPLQSADESVLGGDMIRTAGQCAASQLEAGCGSKTILMVRNWDHSAAMYIFLLPLIMGLISSELIFYVFWTRHYSLREAAPKKKKQTNFWTFPKLPWPPLYFGPPGSTFSDQHFLYYLFITQHIVRVQG